MIFIPLKGQKNLMKNNFNNSVKVNSKGHLEVGGCDCLELAEKYGTPLYVLDETMIRNICREYLQSFKKYYDGNGLPLYASKALCCMEMCRIAKQENIGLDVVSGGEIYTALKAGYPAEKIHFHGNNKTVDEIEMAVEAGVGKIVMDNLSEIQRVNNAAEKFGKTVNVSMRIKPGVDAHTHDFIRTGQIDSKFGFALETGEAFEGVKEVLKAKSLNFTELHCHIGSQIFDIAPFVAAAEIMMDFIAKIKNELGHQITELNLGGGFGIKYVDSDKPVAYEKYMEAVSKAIKAKAEEHNIPVPYIYIEPGRSIVGEAGVTLYTVGSVKEIPNVRSYVAIDGGMTDNIRYALYGSAYTVINASKADKDADYKATIAGKCCESGDLVQENCMIAKPDDGDVIAVLSTGAYNYSMASNYNRNPRPAIVMVKDGESRVIVKRESYEDIIRNDI